MGVNGTTGKARHLKAQWSLYVPCLYCVLLKVFTLSIHTGTTQLWIRNSRYNWHQQTLLTNHTPALPPEIVTNTGHGRLQLSAAQSMKWYGCSTGYWAQPICRPTERGPRWTHVLTHPYKYYQKCSHNRETTMPTYYKDRPAKICL